jgi:tetraacyldisaccharide 4'-kinase
VERDKGLGKVLLSPLAGLFYLVVKGRHILYNTNILKSHKPSTPTICVGNLTVGGTGKTPHIELLIELLSKHYKLAVLSRGYKRKHKGSREVLATDSSSNVGDEPLQIKQKFPTTPVFVNANRVEGVTQITEAYPDVAIILLDDAFQHRKISAGLNILLIDYNRPIWEDTMLPIGNLRDSYDQINRANVVIITKCPQDISPMDKRILTKKLQLYPYQTLLFSHIEYDQPKPLFPTAVPYKTSINTIVVAGIAVPKPFINHVESMGTTVQPLIFPDHHNFTSKDIDLLVSSFRRYNQPVNLVTTEKDAKRLWDLSLPEDVKKYLYFVPIKAKLSDSTDNVLFNKIVRYVKENSSHGGIHKGKNTQ